MFNQLLNGIMRHPDSQKLLKIPIGLMPGGSSNAL
jgi:diacylglycerol kinase family enzyme